MNAKASRNKSVLIPCGSWAGFKRREPFEPVELHVGDRVRLDWQRKRWMVAAVSENFVVLTQQASFQPKGQVFYTILDWRSGVYGPVNTIGQGWDVLDPAELDRLMMALESQERTVSYRNRLAIQSVEVA
jgi:hypothetical protein